MANRQKAAKYLNMLTVTTLILTWDLYYFWNLNTFMAKILFLPQCIGLGQHFWDLNTAKSTIFLGPQYFYGHNIIGTSINHWTLTLLVYQHFYARNTSGPQYPNTFNAKNMTLKLVTAIFLGP